MTTTGSDSADCWAEFVPVLDWEASCEAPSELLSCPAAWLWPAALDGLFV